MLKMYSAATDRATSKDRERPYPSSPLRHVFPSFHLIILVCKSDSQFLSVFPSLSLSPTLSILSCSLARPLPSFQSPSLYPSVFLLSFDIPSSPVIVLKAKFAEDHRMLCVSVTGQVGVCVCVCVQTQASHVMTHRSFSSPKLHTAE